MEGLEFTVSEAESGERLDRFVARSASLTRNLTQRLISTGAVSVEGSVRAKNYLLKRGQLVRIERPEPYVMQPIPQDIPVKIVYEDEDLAVVSKPAGMVVHPAAGHENGTLVNALLHAMGGLSEMGGHLRPGIVHRLDRDTSGLMVVARNDPTYEKLRDMVSKRELKRLYLALVHGVPATRYGNIDAPVGRDAADRKKMAVTGDAGRDSLTRFQVIRAFVDAALLEVELVTGRTHQIRVHLSYIGHPVIGDHDYGRRGKLETFLALDRQFLHAYRLSFAHPSSGEIMNFEDHLPPDLEKALARLEGI